jgi:Malectin domain
VKKFLQIMAMGVLACLPAAAQTQQAIRVKCGGPSDTDSHGQVWLRLQHRVASTNGATTVGTSDPRLARTNRCSRDPLIYTFSVANGAYRVNLPFAENSEPQQAVGARVFNVRLNGTVVLRDFDIFATVGADIALVESFNSKVSNGQMVIEFDRIVQNA